MDRAAHAAADPLLVYLLRKQGVCWNMRSWLQELFERHGREVNRFLRRRGHTVEAADDLTHDAFLRVMLSAREQDVENPRAYLHQVARNLSIDMDRRERRMTRAELSDLDFATIADPSPSPETIVSDRQRLAIAEDFIGQLPERTRYAFEAHRMGEKTIAEIANELGLSTTRTWTLIRSAYGQLRARLDEDDG